MSDPSLKELLLRARTSADGAPRHMRTAGRRLRILLVQPPDKGGVRSLLPHFEEGTESIGFKPPLGILYIATSLKERSQHEVQVIDCVAERLTFDQLQSRAKAFQPDVVGISAWTDFWYPAYRSGELIKSALPDVHICYGGPHVAIYPEETLDAPFIDSVVVGDGEIPFLYLCNMVSHGVADNSLPGLHLAAGGVKSQPDTFYIEGDLDAVGIPDRTLLPIDNYNSVLSREAFVTTMITSRGCPHQCTFCKLNFQKTIARSAESVIEEFRRIQALGIREVEIYDDTFTWGKQRLEDICNGLIREGIKVQWAVRDRVTRVDPALLNLMWKAGCRRIHFGVESGVQNVIDRMKKRITLDQARAAVKAAKAARITVLTHFMFGYLDESVEEMEQTIRFALELNPHYAEFSITIPYAGTEMYETALANGMIDKDYWRRYALHPVENFVSPRLMDTPADITTLTEIQAKAVRSFYFRPSYLVREVLKLGSFLELVRKARMGYRLLQSVLSNYLRSRELASAQTRSTS